MLKIIASFIVFSFSSLCFGAIPISSPISSIPDYYLHSPGITVYTASNTTDAAIWNPSNITDPGVGVFFASVVFGPGSTNETAHVYGLLNFSDGSDGIHKIYKRTLNATILSWANYTSPVTKPDDEITVTIPVKDNWYFKTAVAPNYLAVLSAGSDGLYMQIYINLITGTTAKQVQITSTMDVESFTLGNIWYDKGSEAFFYTYSKTVTAPLSYEYTIHLGGIYKDGTAYWTNPLTFQVASTATTNPIFYLMGGGDNWAKASNIYIVYKDAMAGIIYVSKTALATTTTAGGNFKQLVSDDIPNGQTYIPIGVWASNYTYGIACYNQTQADTTTFVHTVINFLNGTEVGSNSWMTMPGAYGANSLAGWPINTGYTLVVGDGFKYTMRTFYANGTASRTSINLGILHGPISLYEDPNGAMWIGWQDVDTANAGLTYTGYLGILQEQIYPTVIIEKTNYYFKGIVLSTLVVFIAHNLISIWA